MSMTKKQAREYIDDENNWHLYHIRKPFRVLRLDFRGHSWLKSEVRVYSEVRERMESMPEEFWLKQAVYKFDPVRSCVTDVGIGVTALAEAIWELDRES